MRASHQISTLIISVALGLGSTPALANKNHKNNKNNHTNGQTNKNNAATDDASITKNIKDKIRAEKKITSSISVDTKNGVVQLSGDVKSKDEASEAVQIAESTAGVKEVKTDKLAVKGQDKTNNGHDDNDFEDAMTTAKVKGQFLKEKIMGDQPIAVWSIHVETKNGVVMLTGTADDEAQVSNAKKIAAGVSGVKKVESSIKIEKPQNNKR